jgi:hypothetical protein
MEMTRWPVKRGRKVVPLFVVFQIPPAAAATKKVLDGLGIPSTSVILPDMLAGPTERQRKAERAAESRGVDSWACREWPSPRKGVQRKVREAARRRRNAAETEGARCLRIVSPGQKGVGRS